jgi:hypothetical protein
VHCFLFVEEKLRERKQKLFTSKWKKGVCFAPNKTADFRWELKRKQSNTMQNSIAK